MRKLFRSFLLAGLLVGIAPFVNAQAPPPPSHSQNGNQTAPGGTGCPLDRSQGIMLVLGLSLASAGVVLYRKGRTVRAEEVK